MLKATNVVGIEITNKSCLIMDEVDGMSAGDRGGVGALNQLIKKTKVSLDTDIEISKALRESYRFLSFASQMTGTLRS